ncbi:MAG: molybdenum cofactor cytidylyltransferase, partial [Acidobacteria bacterium]|nr:molybdenum cofactor cytidylyltransferase [Acidobacteriota bacterium]
MILAAGLSRRMGFPKALLVWDGETYLDRMIRTFGDVCGEVVVVLRPEQENRIPVRGARTVFNPDAGRGQLSSLQTGLAAVAGESVLFSPVDYAHVREATIASVVAAPAAPIVQPEFASVHGHPVLVSRSVV